MRGSNTDTGSGRLISMKKIKALISFTGAVTMAVGETADVADEVAADLLRAGFAELAEADKEKKAKKK